MTHGKSPLIIGMALGLIVAACYTREPYYPPQEIGLEADSGVQMECELPEEQEMRSLVPSEYAKMCEPHLGVVPAIDCGAGAFIPVYVDGVEVFEDPGQGNCDNPRAGECTPGSSIRREEGVNPDGTPRPEVVWVSLCRHDQLSEDTENHVQIIGYNYQTGATCFFGRGDNEPWTSINEQGMMVGVLPGPDEEGFDTAYTVSDDKPCVGCHTSNPFIHTAWTKSAVGEGDERVVPIVNGFDAPYFVVGAPEWDMRTLYIEGNGCLDCHRVGMETVRLLTEDPWFPNEEMPPADPGSMAGDYAALVECWYSGPENTPGCEWVVPPAGGCPTRIADETYPNVSEDYNQGGNLDEPPSNLSQGGGGAPWALPPSRRPRAPGGHGELRALSPEGHAGGGRSRCLANRP